MSEGDFSPEVQVGKEGASPRFGGWTAPSLEHPQRNEDNLFHNSEFQIAAVFDGVGGVGGEAGGSAAAIIAGDVIKERLKRISNEAPPEGVKQVMVSALFETNGKILEGPVKRGKTTASVVKLWTGPQGERKVIIANLGDSRIYRLKVDGSLEQLTQDDNLTQEAAQRGELTAEQARKIDQCTDLRQLTPKEGEFFASRNIITQALGDRRLSRQTVEERAKIVSLKRGERLLLCTDGVCDNLTDKEIAKTLSSRLEPRKKAANLVGVAKHRSQQGMARSKPDDITAIVVEV